MTEIYLR